MIGCSPDRHTSEVNALVEHWLSETSQPCALGEDRIAVGAEVHHEFKPGQVVISREAAVAEFEIRYRGRRIERFDSDVDPADEFACVALLKRRAQDCAARRNSSCGRSTGGSAAGTVPGLSPPNRGRGRGARSAGAGVLAHSLASCGGDQCSARTGVWRMVTVLPLERSSSRRAVQARCRNRAGLDRPSARRVARTLVAVARDTPTLRRLRSEARDPRAWVTGLDPFAQVTSHWR